MRASSRIEPCHAKPINAANASASSASVATKPRRLRRCCHSSTTSTSAYASHAAREPASRIGNASTEIARARPRPPHSRRAASNTNGASTASVGPSLRLPAPKMPDMRSCSAAPPRLQPVDACSQASTAHNVTIAPPARSRRGHAAGARTAQPTNSANGSRRRLPATVDQVLPGATASIVDNNAGSQ